MVKLAGALLICISLSLSNPGVAAELEQPEIRSRVLDGLSRLYNGYYRDAEEIFTELERQLADSPLPRLLLAEVYWWQLFTHNGNLRALGKLDFLDGAVGGHDAKLKQNIAIAIGRAEKRLKSGGESAENYFYVGMGYGLRARLESARGNGLAAARSAKKMKANLEKCLALDPDFHDARAGLGAYNYYVDALPAIIKPLRFVMFLPAGDREKGIEELKLTLRNGSLCQVGASFYLICIYLGKGALKEALELASDLRARYPDNPVFYLIEAEAYRRVGDQARAAELSAKALDLARVKHKGYDGEIARLASEGPK